MKIGEYIVIMMSLVMFLEILGFHTTAGGMLSAFNVGVDATNSSISINGGGLESSSFYSGLIALLSVGFGAAIIAGLLSRTFDWKITLKGFMTGTVMYLFAGTGFILINEAISKGNMWMVWIISIVFIPFTAGFLFAVFNWFGGGE